MVIWNLWSKKFCESLVASDIDVIIWTRADLQWLSPHPKISFLEENEIWVPDGEDYDGLNDRHAVMGRFAAQAHFSRWDHFRGTAGSIQYSPLIQAIISSPKRMFWNPESVFDLQMQRFDIDVWRVPFPMFISCGYCRVNTDSASENCHTFNSFFDANFERGRNDLWCDPSTSARYGLEANLAGNMAIRINQGWTWEPKRAYAHMEPVCFNPDDGGRQQREVVCGGPYIIIIINIIII